MTSWRPIVQSALKVEKRNRTISQQHGVTLLMQWNISPFVTMVTMVTKGEMF